MCDFANHGLYGEESIQVGHDGEEQAGEKHVCGTVTMCEDTDMVFVPGTECGTKRDHCECFCGGQTLGTFNEELEKRTNAAQDEMMRERTALDDAADDNYFGSLFSGDGDAAPTDADSR
jgi:hypothetical protein